MTELIRNQLEILFIMTAGGMAAGLVETAFREFFALGKVGLPGKIILTGVCYLCIGLLFGEFLFYCENGKVTFLPAAAFFTGIWLWGRIARFCLISER